jgi:K+-sensing histidine kinase KdpD
MRLKVSSKVARESVGAAICLGATALAVMVWHGRPNPPSVLPLIFLVIVVWVAVRFGRHAGFLGTIGASAALAFFVYAPAHSFHINDHTTAGYMVALFFGGLVASELLADPT